MRKRLRVNKEILFIVVWIAVIWGHSMMPDVASEKESVAWLNVISDIISHIGITNISLHFVRKLAHFTEYFILGLLMMNGLRKKCMQIKKEAFVCGLQGFFVAFIDETIQLFVKGRAGQIQDVWLDFSGVCVGVALSFVIIYNIRKRRSH